MTHEEYVGKVKLVNPHIKIASEYRGLKNPITYICPICGNGVTIKRPSNLYHAEIYGCRSCFMKKLGDNRSLKLQNELTDIINKVDNIEILGFYKRDEDNRLVVSLKCTRCNYEWERVGKEIKQTQNIWTGCPNCWEKSEKRISPLRKGYDQYAEAIKDETKDRLKEWMIKNDVTLMSKHHEIKTNTRVSVRCNTCGYEYKTSVNNLLTGKNDCAGCKGTRLTTESYKKRLVEKKRYDLEMLSEYTTSIEKIKFKCKTCNCVWWALPHQILSGSGCPRCNSSSGERYISFLLDDLGKEYEREKIFDGCKATRHMPFDFYLPQYNICIEYDGEQHYKPVIFGTSEDICSETRAKQEFKLRQKRDKIKDEFCEKNDITLIRVPYYIEKNKIENMIVKEINNKSSSVS